MKIIKHIIIIAMIMASVFVGCGTKTDKVNETKSESTNTDSNNKTVQDNVEIEKYAKTDAIRITNEGEMEVDINNDKVSIEKTESGEKYAVIDMGNGDTVKVAVKEDESGSILIDTTKTISDDGKNVVEVTAPGKTSTPVPSLTPVATTTQVPTEPTKKPAEPSVTETPVPTTQAVPGTTGTPTPTVKENTPIPTVKGSTPTPTVKVNTPTPTVKVNIPTPTVKTNTPTPTVKVNTPTPTVKVNTPTPTVKVNTPTPTVQACSHTWKRLINYDLRDTSGYVTEPAWDEDVIIGTQKCKSCGKTAYDLGYQLNNVETGEWISSDVDGWSYHCLTCPVSDWAHHGYESCQKTINTIHHPSTTTWVESSTYYVQTYAWECSKCGTIKDSTDLRWITQLDALDAGWFD